MLTPVGDNRWEQGLEVHASQFGIAAEAASIGYPTASVAMEVAREELAALEQP
jgi:hypothetical protein